jgi:ubiquinone/menaquinone biosynthesis C-methylase UbiE
MDARLQRRVQRYGWDRAARDYEPLWQSQLAAAQRVLLTAVAPAGGERVLDVACGTGLVSFAAAKAVGPEGEVLGVDLSAGMIEAARMRVAERGQSRISFARMDAEHLLLPPGTFDVVLCALGLMYVPDPSRALAEMQRVMRAGGRLGLAVWGERARCGWSSVFGIVQAEVASEVCPLFFSLGQGEALGDLCAGCGFEQVRLQRITTTLRYAGAAEACAAAFAGGPVALAWAHFSAATRARVCERYLATIARWSEGAGYAVPAEFVIVTAAAPAPAPCGAGQHRAADAAPVPRRSRHRESHSD